MYIFLNIFFIFLGVNKDLYLLKVYYILYIVIVYGENLDLCLLRMFLYIVYRVYFLVCM